MGTKIINPNQEKPHHSSLFGFPTGGGGSIGCVPKNAPGVGATSGMDVPWMMVL
jgi:hypothetical protein